MFIEWCVFVSLMAEKLLVCREAFLSDLFSVFLRPMLSYCGRSVAPRVYH